MPLHSKDRPPRVSFVLGGARSGKSRFAESLVASWGCAAIYVATAEPGDAEMAHRIAAHRARRGPGFTTIEEPLELARTLRRESDGRAILVDCLTLWLSNLMHRGRNLATERSALLASLEAAPGPIVLVANEVGLGIVPENPLARAFRDEAGMLNCEVAAAADRVVFVAAGLPLVLKGDL